MIGILEYVIGMLRILANEVEDTQDGEERGYTSSGHAGHLPLEGKAMQWEAGG